MPFKCLCLVARLSTRRQSCSRRSLHSTELRRVSQATRAGSRFLDQQGLSKPPSHGSDAGIGRDGSTAPRESPWVPKPAISGAESYIVASPQSRGETTAVPGCELGRSNPVRLGQILPVARPQCPTTSTRRPIVALEALLQALEERFVQGWLVGVPGKQTGEDLQTA